MDPLSLASLDSCSPFCRLSATSSPGRGKSFHSGGSPWQGREVSALYRSAGEGDTFRLRQSLSLSGEVARPKAVTERVCLRGRTLSVSLRSTAPPRGGALGRTGRSRPHSSTAGRSLPLSYKLFALAKASPFRERWHGEAVTERVPHAQISTSVCKFYAQALIFPAGRATINSVSSCPKRGCGQGSADPAHCREGRRPATGVLRAARAP